MIQNAADPTDSGDQPPVHKKPGKADSPLYRVFIKMELFVSAKAVPLMKEAFGKRFSCYPGKAKSTASNGRSSNWRQKGSLSHSSSFARRSFSLPGASASSAASQVLKIRS